MHHNTFTQPATLQIQVASASDRGQIRARNEDAIKICEPTDSTLQTLLGRLYLLADGAGGHAAGEVASQLAVETIAAFYYDTALLPSQNTQSLLERTPWSHHPSHTNGLLIEHLRQAFLEAHRHIQDQAECQQGCAGMVTTCVAALVQDNHAIIAHVGDSRAYLLRPKTSSPLTCLTTDHNLATELARAGILTEQQRATSSSRHILLRALGGYEQRNNAPDLTCCDVTPGDFLILCCDGLWSTVSEAQMIAIVSNNEPQAACAELIRLANAAGGEDNISVIILSLR